MQIHIKTFCEYIILFRIHLPYTVSSNKKITYVILIEKIIYGKFND